MMKKKLFKKIIISIIIIIIIIVLIVTVLYSNEMRTLLSIKKIDNYPLYEMKYVGDYGFSDFLKIGAKSDDDIEKFVTKRLLKGLDIDLGISSAGCSAFTAKNSKGETLYGRNFDFDYAPTMILYTNPTNGYASISTVNLAFAGFGYDNIPKQGISINNFLTLAAPYLSFDGMNEKGVTMALLAVPFASPPIGDDKITLNTTTAIRLVLDNAANVDEAVNLLKKYNFYFSGDVECHYLISDRSGNSVVLEFLDNEIKLVNRTENYQAATNFIMYNNLNIGEGYTEFDRYNKIIDTLKKNKGIIEEMDSLKLLDAVKIKDRTQWSILYNQISGDVKVAMGGNYNNIYNFHLNMK